MRLRCVIPGSTEMFLSTSVNTGCAGVALRQGHKEGHLVGRCGKHRAWQRTTDCIKRTVNQHEIACKKPYKYINK